MKINEYLTRSAVMCLFVAIVALGYILIDISAAQADDGPSARSVCVAWQPTTHLVDGTPIDPSMGLVYDVQITEGDTARIVPDLAALELDTEFIEPGRKCFEVRARLPPNNASSWSERLCVELMAAPQRVTLVPCGG